MDGLELLYVTLLPIGEHSGRVSPSRRAPHEALCTSIEGGRLMRSCSMKATVKSTGRSSSGLLKGDLVVQPCLCWPRCTQAAASYIFPLARQMCAPHTLLSTMSHLICAWFALAQWRRRNFSHLTGSWVFRQAVETVRLAWHGTLTANTISNA